MLKTTVDTNILVSSVISIGNEFKLLKLAKSGRIKLILSFQILEEFIDVISRPKFGFSQNQVSNILKQILTISNIIIPTIKVNVIKEDISDNMVLECAVTANVDYIISGDSHLLNLKKYKNIPIIKTLDILSLIKK